MKNIHCHFKQHGQALVVSIFFALIGAMGLVLMYNTSQTTTEKTRLVNAADAAAYSGGVYVARQLNYMAYTNRAMIANHVVVGHFVSYVSWLRYMNVVSGKIAAYTRFIPYVNAATAYAYKLVRGYKRITERAAKPIVIAINGLNRMLSLSQINASRSIIGVISNSSLLSTKIMDKVAKAYDGSIRVNYPADIKSITSAIGGAQVVHDGAQFYRFYKRYNAGDDSGRIRRMVESSYGLSAPWIRGNRGWDIPLGLWKLEKHGSTQHVVSSHLQDWRASDRLVYKWWTVKGWKSRTVASGSATAREFYSSYDGIPSYYDVSSRGKNANQIVNLSAYATMPISRAKLMNLLGFGTDIQRMAALSRVEIFHKRNTTLFDSVAGNEYANLYNPFWQVRLTKNTF